MLRDHGQLLTPQLVRRRIRVTHYTCNSNCDHGIFNRIKELIDANGCSNGNDACTA